MLLDAVCRNLIVLEIQGTLLQEYPGAFSLFRSVFELYSIFLIRGKVMHLNVGCCLGFLARKWLRESHADVYHSSEDSQP